MRRFRFVRLLAVSVALVALAESWPPVLAFEATSQETSTTAVLEGINLPRDAVRYAAEKERAARVEAPVTEDLVLDSGPTTSSVEGPSEARSSNDVSTASTSFGGTFEGINRVQGGADPPDTIVGASVNTVLEAVNRRIRLTDFAGNELATQPLQTFFSTVVSSTTGVFDPKVYFDRNSSRPRYYVVGLQVAGRNNTSTTDDLSRLLIAVSRTADPSNLDASQWCFYFVNTTNDAGTSQASWADFPGLGVGADALVVTANQFEFVQTCDSQGQNCRNQFRHSRVRVFKKNVLNNNASSCPGSSSLGLASFQVGGFTVQPVQHYTSPSSFTGITNPVYLVETSGSPNYKIYRVSNVSSSSPILETVDIRSGSSYATPPQAPGGSTSTSTTAPRTGLIDTGDTRVLQAAGRGNSIWAVHSTSCSSSVGPACYRYLRFSVGDGRTAPIQESHTVGRGAGTYSFFPSIAVNKHNDVGIAFQSVSPGSSNQLSARGAVIEINATSVDSLPMATGSCLLDRSLAADASNAYRAGDYTGAQTDPFDDAGFYFAGEYARTLPSQTGSNICQWATRIAPAFFDVGTFTYSPEALTVSPQEHATLSFGWEHPSRWRDLNALFLRVGPAESPPLWIRFRVEENDFSVSRSPNGNFGRTAPPGSDVVLRTSGGALHLAGTRVIGSGPEGPSVELQLDVTFSSRASGGTYPVEVAALDNIGHFQGYDPAGSITVE